jgi:hypothetical protein
VRSDSQKKTREKLIEDLEVWAIKNQSLDHPYVSGLHSALKKNSSLDYWAKHSAITELPQARSNQLLKFISRAKRVEQFRNVMIFSPIAYTWASIAIAATSYATFSDDNLPINLNFLDFWENGYGTLPAIWKLSNVAIVDFILILSIIIASIVANQLENRIDDLEANLISSIEIERTALAYKIDLFLFDYLKPSPLVLSKTVQNSIRALSRVSKELLNSAERIDKRERLSPKIEKISKQLIKIERDFKRKT